MTDDGFVTIGDSKVGRPPLTNCASFGRNFAWVPPVLTTKRVTWEWDGANTVRLRGADAGRLQLLRGLSPGAAHRVVAGSLYTAIGRKLSGRYPITRIDGNDLYIDVRDEARIGGA